MSSTSEEQRPETRVAAIGPHRLVAARLTWALHILVVIFLLTGWAWPWPAAWWVYAASAPLIQLGWIVFDDYCWLSIIEAKLRGESLVVPNAAGEEESRVFVGELLESILKRPVENRVSNAISYGVLWVGFVIACARLYDDALGDR